VTNQAETTEWMKLGDAAYALGVSEITLRRKVKCGKISHEMRDGKYYILLQKNPETGKYLDSNPENYVSTLAQTTSPSNEQRMMALQREIEIRDSSIRELKRTVEDQQTLISFLEQTLTSLQNPR
jgi:hypothetical protein